MRRIFSFASLICASPCRGRWTPPGAILQSRACSSRHSIQSSNTAACPPTSAASASSSSCLTATASAEAPAAYLVTPKYVRQHHAGQAAPFLARQRPAPRAAASAASVRFGRSSLVELLERETSACTAPAAAVVACTPTCAAATALTDGGGRSDNAPSPHVLTGVLPSSASAAVQQQQQTLRQWFDDADAPRAPTRVRLRKDKQLYKAERAMARRRQEQQGGQQRREGISRTVDVQLAPVVALQTYGRLLTHREQRQHAERHTPSLSRAAATSPPHPLSATVPSLHMVQEALLLQQHASQYQLVQANQPIWIRCLRCFHVFYGKPKKLLTSSSAGTGEPVVHLSSIEREKEVERRRRRFQRQPGRALTTSSSVVDTEWVPLPAYRSGAHRQAERRRREKAAQEEPECCPHCGSTRVQWVLEYIHHRTHCK